MLLLLCRYREKHSLGMKPWSCMPSGNTPFPLLPLWLDAASTLGFSITDAIASLPSRTKQEGLFSSGLNVVVHSDDAEISRSLYFELRLIRSRCCWIPGCEGNIIMSFAMRVRRLQEHSGEMAPDAHHSCENLPALSVR